MEKLKKEDLWSICPRCKGKGETAELNGGPSNRFTVTGPCDTCEGRGIALTENGEVIRDFVLALQMVR